MLRIEKVIVICREVNRQTGQIAVYVVPMEIDEHTVVRLSLRSMFNPELRYFFAYEEVYQEQKRGTDTLLQAGQLAGAGGGIFPPGHFLFVLLRGIGSNDLPRRAGLDLNVPHFHF